MKVMVFGGAGFIGSHIVDRLLDIPGFEVAVFDSLVSGSADNLKGYSCLKFDVKDIYDYYSVEKEMDFFRPDVIVHAAVAPVLGHDTSNQDVRTNVIGTLNILHAARALNVKRILYFQTALVYGDTDVSPIPVTHPVAPTNSYAISKLCAENYIRNSGLDYISFRLANHFGPRNLCGPVPIFFKNITKRLESIIVPARRDFVFVSDLVELVVKACNGVGESGIYHVASGTDYSILDMYRSISQIIGIEAPYEYLEDYDSSKNQSMKTMLLDASHTREVFNWSPQVDLFEGLVKAVSWYESNGVERTYTHLKTK